MAKKVERTNTIEFDIKVDDKELQNAIDKARELDFLLSKLNINKIENIYITINHFKDNDL